MTRKNPRNPAGRLGLAVALLLTAGAVSAGQPLFSDVDETRIAVQAENRLIVPARYRAFRLDIDAMRRDLAAAPDEFTRAPKPKLALPMPDGSTLTLVAERSPIMAPELAARYPGIETFRVYGADRDDVFGRIGWTSAGLHGIVFTADGTVYIDPYSRGDDSHYLSYYRRDFHAADAEPFSCGTVADAAVEHDSDVHRTSVPGISGETLRTYRLAMAATYEYTQFHSGPLPTLASKTAAMNNGIIPTMNRVNGIYERDIAVRMILVPNNEDIVFDTPADPYVNEDGISMLATNPTVIDSAIGQANYDIGHVFSTGGGGVAGLGVVCRTGAGFGHKANGVTGRGAPVGDPFDVDYVAHEIGHQFGGNHTFNGSTGSCSGGNRNGGTAYEVGSGTTIMAYAGICGAQNTQSNSDDLFHLASLLEMNAYITTGAGDGCAAKTATGNTPPFVDAGGSYTIPTNTPFRLTATGGDADGDMLRYAWEQYDLGPAGSNATDTGAGPLFRAFNTEPSPVRVLPRHAEKPGGPFPYGESLPTTNRTMNFRVTARDNRVGGGGFAWDAMQVTTTTSAQFAVDEPVATTVWNGATYATVLWTMTGTDTLPIDTQLVDILLSTDGGETYPYVVATGVANDGQHEILVPNHPTTDAVIQVAADDNIYFEISEPFEIVGSTDTDADGIADSLDNCQLVANPTQCDTNGDGFGNHCDADLNDNNVVNFADLGIFKAAFLASPGDANWNPDADLNCNDVVNFPDLAVFKSMWLGAPGP